MIKCEGVGFFNATIIVKCYSRLRSRQPSLMESLKTSSTLTEACKEPGINSGRACNWKARCRSQSTEA
ncbi:hypothetical protein Hanom_Chr11g01027141 [Helianthus anomalus]